MRIYEIITVLLTVLVLVNTEHKRQNSDSKTTDVATCKVIKRNFWNFLYWFWSSTIIKQQKQEHYINLQTDPLDNPGTTRQILMGLEMSIKPYPNWQPRWSDDPDCVFSDRSVPTRNRTWSSGLESLLTLAVSNTASSVILFKFNKSVIAIAIAVELHLTVCFGCMILEYSPYSSLITAKLTWVV